MTIFDKLCVDLLKLKIFYSNKKFEDSYNATSVYPYCHYNNG